MVVSCLSNSLDVDFTSIGWALTLRTAGDLGGNVGSNRLTASKSPCVVACLFTGEGSTVDFGGKWCILLVESDLQAALSASTILLSVIILESLLPGVTKGPDAVDEEEKVLSLCDSVVV